MARLSVLSPRAAVKTRVPSLRHGGGVPVKAPLPWLTVPHVRGQATRSTPAAAAASAAVHGTSIDTVDAPGVAGWRPLLPPPAPLFDVDDALAASLTPKGHYYDSTVPPEARPAYPALQGRVDVDVAILGGGFCGLSTAIELRDRGVSCAVVDAKVLGYGASGRNGGQTLLGLCCDMSVVEEQLGEEPARRIWDATQEAVNMIHDRTARFGIDVDWRPGYVTLATHAQQAEALKKWTLDMRDRYGMRATVLSGGDLAAVIGSPRYVSGVLDPVSGHINPLKYVVGLGKAAASLGARIYEHSPVSALEEVPSTSGGAPRWRLRTPGGSVTASHVLLAGNCHLENIQPALHSRVLPVSTYIIATKPLDPGLLHSLVPTRAAFCDSNYVLDYFRPTPDHRLLYGGRASGSTAHAPALVAEMRQRMARTFPQLAGVPIDYAWGGFCDVSTNRAPDFGRLSDIGLGAQYKNVYYLQGFSGHGLALSGLGGRMVAEAVTGAPARLDLFARLRHGQFPGGRRLRVPITAAVLAFYRLRDALRI